MEEFASRGALYERSGHEQPRSNLSSTNLFKKLIEQSEGINASSPPGMRSPQSRGNDYPPSPYQTSSIPEPPERRL
jgi:hypothetical protein